MTCKDLRKKGKAVFRRHRVETETSVCFSRALHDKSARLSVDAVGMSPDPAAVRADKGKRKRLKDLVCSQPDVLIAAQLHFGLEVAGLLAHPAVHSIAGHDEIRL